MQGTPLRGFLPPPQKRVNGRIRTRGVIPHATKGGRNSQAMAARERAVSLLRWLWPAVHRGSLEGLR